MNLQKRGGFLFSQFNVNRYDKADEIKINTIYIAKMNNL